MQDPPPLTVTRHAEDYRYLADPTRRSGAWWEPLKHFRLGSNDGAYLSTGAELRLRHEIYRERLWGGSAAADDGYTWARALPYADLHLGRSVRAFGQLAIAYASGSALKETAVEQTGVDVAQAFVEVGARVRLAGRDSRLSVRAGRRLISYGAGRLIAPRYGPNVMQPFDGGFATLDVGRAWSVDAFLARPVAPGTGDFDDRSGDPSLWALYAVRRDLKAAGGRSSLDLYYIGYREDGAVFDQGRALEKRHTIGARLAGGRRGWSWDWEGMYQFGSFGDGRISAWSIGTRTGYGWPRHRLQPSLTFEAAIISGDADRADPDLQTFNALYPNGNFFGELTPIGPYNLVTAGPTAAARISDEVGVEAKALFHWRQSRGDGVYSVPGILVRSGAGSRAARIGTQGSVSLTWAPSRTFDITATYGFFAAGRFLEETGPSRTTHFVGTQARFRY